MNPTRQNRVTPHLRALFVRDICARRGDENAAWTKSGGGAIVSGCSRSCRGVDSCYGGGAVRAGITRDAGAVAKAPAGELDHRAWLGAAPSV